MKKTFAVIVFTVLIALLCVSCSYNITDCVYAYFKDTSFLLVFNQSKKMLYRIELPLDLIVDYGKANNLTTVPEAIESFTGLKPTMQVVGTPDTYRSLERILECWMGDNLSKEDYLNTLILHTEDLGHDPLLSKLTKLCGTDVSTFLKHLSLPETIKTANINCENFLNFKDPEYSKKYFQKWVRQLMGE